MPAPEPETLEIRFRLNGADVSVRAEPAARLLDVLRERGLTGTKEGCGEGECGSCTVHLDGLPVNACLVPAWQARGRTVATIESIPPETLGSFLDTGATQCGACTPGVVMTAAWIRACPDLLARFEPRTLMAGNLCRCTGYDGILDGLLDALRRDATADGARP